MPRRAVLMLLITGLLLVALSLATYARLAASQSQSTSLRSAWSTTTRGTDFENTFVELMASRDGWKGRRQEEVFAQLGTPDLIALYPTSFELGYLFTGRSGAAEVAVVSLGKVGGVQLLSIASGEVVRPGQFMTFDAYFSPGRPTTFPTRTDQ